MRKALFKLLFFFSLLYSYTVLAIEWDINNVLKYELSTFSLPDNSPLVLTTDQDQNFQQLSYRGQFAIKHGDFEFHTDYTLNLIRTDSLALYPEPSDQSSLFDLSSTIDSTQQQRLQHRLDRFYIGYQTDNSSFRFGRQAVTWGNGFIFNVMDIFNPFSPTALDREFKPGDDMLYAQHLSDTGNDWQFIYLPRRNTDGDLESDQSSLVVKLHTQTGAHDLDMLLAQHFDENILGIGTSHALGESLVRLDITHTELSNGQSRTSLSTNIDYSWLTFGKNFYGFIEYYFNGFGITDYTDPVPTYLQQRINRGELYSYYRNYLALGLRIELHPLVNLSPTLINNIDDRSRLLSVNLNYDWHQNLILTTQLNLGFGSSTSEYNGTLSTGDSLSAQLVWYF